MIRTVPQTFARLSVLCAPAFWMPAAFAASEGGARFGAPASAAAREPLAAGGDAMQVLLSLGLVLAVIVLLGWLARRLRVMPRGRSGALRVVDEVAVGAKERAVILEVDGVRLVLGVGEGRVSVLHRSETPSVDAGAVQAMEVPARAATAPVPRFADLLGKALGR